jgi:pimeloyl-ACP methyl ester carboxylesterase
MATWIFLRGLTRESRHWGDFVGQFQHALLARQVVTLDFAGNGQFNHLASSCRVNEMVEQCRAQLASRCIKPPYYLLAMSLGGMVAVEWAQAYPQEIEGQVLINTSMRPFSPFYQRLIPVNYATLLKLVFLDAGPDQWERAVLSLTSQRKDMSVLPLWLAVRMSNPVSRSNALRQLWAAARFSAPPRPLCSRTLFLASEHDNLVSVECSKSMARHWQCVLQVHPSAGHDLPLDDGSWVIQQVQKWLPASE